VDKFRPVLDGSRPIAGDAWRATLREMTEAQPLGPSGTGRLRKAMLKRSEIHALPDPVPLIKDVLYRNSVVVLAGKFGTYKSFVAVSWAACLATGTAWFGHEVPQRVPVIYAAAEGAYGIRKRLNAWETAHGLIPDDLYLIPISVRLNRPEDVRELEELIIETGAAALVFDTLHASTPGVDENDSGEIGAVLDVLRGLQERHGICSILPHHTGHAGERARGSSSVEDDADVSFVIRLDGEDRGPETRRVLAHRKTKDDVLLPEVQLVLRLVEGTGSGYVEPADVFDRENGAAPEVPEQWVTHSESTVDMIVSVLSDHGEARGLTKAETKAIVIERFYGNVKGRLKHSTYSTAFDRAFGRELISNVGGERFSADPLTIAEYRESSAREGANTSALRVSETG
jgi:hypothetical protein